MKSNTRPPRKMRRSWKMLVFMKSKIKKQKSNSKIYCSPVVVSNWLSDVDQDRFEGEDGAVGKEIGAGEKPETASLFPFANIHQNDL